MNEPCTEVKTQLAAIIAEAIQAGKVHDTIEHLELDQARAAYFTMDEQFRVLNQIGFDVVITILPVPKAEKRTGHISVAMGS